MRMKSRITLGLGLAFLLVFLIAGLSIYYLNRISSDAKAILKDNYKSLEYAEKMTRSLNLIRSTQVGLLLRSPKDQGTNYDYYQKAFANFDKYLKAEDNNITEPGERAVVANLKADLQNLKELGDKLWTKNSEKNIYLSDVLPIWMSMDQSLGKIHSLNMQAILEKNERAKASSNSVIAIMVVLTVICVVLGDLYYFYFPSYVAYGLRTLSLRMKEIESGKYDERIALDSGDEFQEISESLDKIVEQLRVKEKNA